MCGIFALLNNTREILTHQFILEQFQKGRGRGPENSNLKNVMIHADFGFHRLAINGLNDASNQPIIIDDIALICNGEIYNYKQLYADMGVTPRTGSDCEVIIHLYKRYGIEYTLQLLDGVFAFALVDYRLPISGSKALNMDSTVYIARDPYGVRPLYVLFPTKTGTSSESDFFSQQDQNIFGFASELKVLTEICQKLNEVPSTRSRRRNSSIPPLYKIRAFSPGSYSAFQLKFSALAKWTIAKHQVPYHQIGFHTNIGPGANSTMEIIGETIRRYLTDAVEKRCVTTERPIACLLSGGLDSSLICALVADYHRKNGLAPPETYSIGLAGSTDLEYARGVAEHLGTKHHEIIVTEDDFTSAIPDVIYAIESYDTTTVRASLGNWLLGKYIAANSQAKVIFNGDGADELMGGYLYMNLAPDSLEFDRETRRLLRNIHRFDVLRSDKSISSHGLEPRTPFLDRTWTQYYMTLPANLRFHKVSGVMEKALVRTAFMEHLDSRGQPILPEAVLRRKKEAFSDGVSKTTRSLYEILGEYGKKRFLEDDAPQFPTFQFDLDLPDTYAHLSRFHPDLDAVQDYLPPKTAEQFFYRKTFESRFRGLGKVIPYFWMPKYVEAKDASARTLAQYSHTVDPSGSIL